MPRAGFSGRASESRDLLGGIASDAFGAERAESSRLRLPHELVHLDRLAERSAQGQNVEIDACRHPDDLDLLWTPQAGRQLDHLGAARSDADPRRRRSLANPESLGGPR